MSNLDQITVTGITGHGHHGVFEHERAAGQEFSVDVTVYVDSRPAAAGDDLAQTVHYGELSEVIHELITGPPVDLIETLAEQVATAALSFPAAQAVDVTVHKPNAPIPVPFTDVTVKIHRTTEQVAVVAESVAAEPDVAVEIASPAPPPPPPPAQTPEGAGLEPAVPEPETPEPEPGDKFDVRPGQPTAAILALGANLGEAQKTLVAAIRDIAAVAEIELVDVSPLARTAPVGPDQPDFFNCVVRILTTLTPRELLRAAHEIEAAHGRERLEHWGPRTLDIDIITFGNLTGLSDDLELPHPRAHERAFVLAPWAELEPNGVLPGLGGGPIAQLAASAPDRAGIRWMSLDWLS